MQQFDQSVVVITGAAGNLGRAVAAAFARQGAHLALLDLNVEGIAPGAVEHRRMIEQLSLGDRPRDIFAPAGTTPASTLNCASDALAACASGPRPRSRLDYALVYPGRGTPRLRVRGAAVVDFADRGRCGVGFLSDHKALQIDLALD